MEATLRSSINVANIKMLEMKRFDHCGTHPRARTHIYHIDSESDKYLYGWCLFFATDHSIRWINFKSWFFFALTQWNKMLSDPTRKTILAIMYRKSENHQKTRARFLEMNRLGCINVICSTKDYIGHCQFYAIKWRLCTFETSHHSPIFFPFDVRFQLAFCVTVRNTS